VRGGGGVLQYSDSVMGYNDVDNDVHVDDDDDDNTSMLQSWEVSYCLCNQTTV